MTVSDHKYNLDHIHVGYVIRCRDIEIIDGFWVGTTTRMDRFYTLSKEKHDVY